MAAYDIVIAGYGPTGAVAGNLLGAAGLSALVVEPSPAIFDIPRAVHFDGETMRIFQHLGLQKQVLEIVREGKSLGFTNARNWQLFHQDLTRVPRYNGWANNLFFNQPQLEKHLRSGVERFANVEVRLGWSLAGLEQQQTHVSATITDAAGATEKIECQYLLGCDGASSLVRKLLAIAQEDLHCDEPWLVVDWIIPAGIQIDRSAYQICDPKRPATLVPCEGRHIRWEFMVNPGDNESELESEESVRALMAPHLHRLSPELKPEDGELIRAKVYAFHALVAETFQQGRVFLLGDAAHQTPPFMGQGMCAGIRDAYNIHWKLCGVLKGELAPAVLDSYTTERRPHVHETIKTAVTMGGIIQNRSRALSFFRDCFLMLGKALPAMASSIKFNAAWHLGAGLFATDGAPVAGGPLGQLLPQGLVQLGGQEPMLSDELLAPGFNVIGFGVNPADFFNQAEYTLKTNAIQIGTSAGAQDIDGALLGWAKKHAVELAVVRPDRQVYGAIGQGSDKRKELAAMLMHLQQRLGG
ncbi:MAG: bifunctional 3-(3-hydroxy-phenyl)propionate/3-hydroxycinnamic acid hydroxylase [Pseudomonadales bacterium]